MSAAPVRDEAGLGFGAALIVHVGARATHRGPQPVEAGMKEPHAPHAGVEAIARIGRDSAMQHLAVRLPVIQDDEAHAMAAANELVREEDLLVLRSADVSNVVP